ncbi:MAG: Nramp family divalent metal transporter [Planctomycetaceae bacterium]|nr:Nramp family divalent metal transporter [Planctomycetaceae bacterium]
MSDAPQSNEVDTELTQNSQDFQAPWPGDQSMPQWDTAGLRDAPKFTIKKWAGMLGPGLILGGAAIGGGEWLVGPEVTAKYGGALLWLATLSIIGQVIYNLEISRYTLYCGEPIFTGKFRSNPGKRFWTPVYMALDFGSLFPYLALSAAIPLFAALVGIVPDPEDHTKMQTIMGIELSHYFWLRAMGVGIFVFSLVPLIFGGKILVALKWVMGFKIVLVLGFLLVLAIGWSSASTWVEIGTGFFKIGTVPTVLAEDVNMNGIIDTEDGETDWDGDGVADVIEPKFENLKNLDQITVAIDFNSVDDIPVQTITYDINSANGQTLTSLSIPPNLGIAAGDYAIVVKSDNSGFIDIDGDGERDGDQVTNVFTSFASGDGMPNIDWTLIAALSALVAISGSGGLTNTTISNYTRDEGWGMGHHVGAIPSLVGGLELQLSHQGAVFDPTAPDAMPRWKRWYKHIMRDQWVIWAPACFIGLALPSMLSVEFLDRGASVPDKWVAATMTAEGVRDRVNGVEITDNPANMTDEALAAQEANEGALGNAFWFMTVFCGFLVLAPSMSTSADGVIRRWVDVFWTTSDRLREMPPGAIKSVYFRVLGVYAIFGFITLISIKPATLLVIAAAIYNYALGISCLHTLYVNRTLLPRQLQARGSMQVALLLAGVFFFFIGCVSSLKQLGFI